MKIFRNMKMSSIIIGIISIVSLLGIVLLFIMANVSSKSMIEKSAKNNMETYLEAEANIVENFVKESEQKLLIFSKTEAVSAALKDPSNADKIAKAQSETLAVHGSITASEGVYLADWNSQVLTHPAPPVVGRVMREGERLTQLQNSMLAADVYDAGIIVSPASGSLILSMYAAVYDESQNPIGYVGGGVMNSQLGEELAAVTASGFENSKFYMINTETNLNYINPNEEMVAQEITEPMLLEVVSKVQAGEASGEFVTKDETGETIMVKYLSIGERNWTVILTDTTSEIYKAANTSGLVLLIACIIAYVVIVGLASFAVLVSTKPLKTVTNAIVDLGKLDLKANEAVVERSAYKNEVGIISLEIETLRKSLTEIVATLSDCSGSFADSADMMNSNSERLVGYVMDNTATTEQLAASITTTNEMIEGVGSRIDNITEMLNKIDSLVANGDEQSANILSSADKMEKTAEASLATSVENLKKNRETISDVMTRLNALSEINNLVSDILNISSQTKLLSLNASIEAARAGENGRGFAVVAEEIGHLAQNSQETASRISEICDTTNENIAKVSDCFDTISKYLEGDVVPKFEEFSAIAKGNNEISLELKNMMSEIKDTISQFNEDIAQISDQMDTMKLASNQNSFGVDDIVDKTTQTSLVAEKMSEMVDENNENVTKLGNIIGEFTNIE